MAIPTTRTEFVKYILRRLGYPAIKINVTEEQIDDRIDDAVTKYVHHHFGGSEKVYLSHQLTALEASTKTVVLDDAIIGVVGVWPIGFSTATGSGSLLFNVPYQILLSEVFGAGGDTTGGLSNYVVLRTQLNTLAELMIGKFPVRYNERTDELHIDCDPSKLKEGGYIIIEAFRKNDPEDYPDVWNDPWLQKYATELVRKQWGENLSKFSGTQTPGGVTVNGMQMISRADEEIQKLEDELTSGFTPIPSDFIG